MASTHSIDSSDRGHAGRLLAHAFSHLLGDQAADDPSYEPLVVIASDRTPASTWLASFLDTTPTRTTVERIAVCHGPALGRMLGTVDSGRLQTDLALHRLVVIDHADEVGGAERQRSLVDLLDALRARGVATCVSVATHPAATATLDPRLASRLAEGLLVMAPTSATSAAASGPHPPRRPVAIQRVVAAVAVHLECPLADLLGPSRCRSIADARSMAMYVARMATGRSYHAIGAACGGRDHTTVLHAVRVVQRRMARDAAYAAEVSRLVDRFSGFGVCSEPVSGASPRRTQPRRRPGRPRIHGSPTANRP